MNHFKNSVILFASSCFLATIVHADPIQPTSLWTSPQGDSRPLLVLEQKLQLIPKTVQDEQGQYLIQLRYPQIAGTPLPKAASSFNQLLQSFIDKTVSQFKNEIEHTKLPQSRTAQDNYLKMNYDLAGFVSQSQHTEYTSIRLGMDSFVQGMAHPNHQTQVFNYDLGHNKELSLSDLFNPKSDYLEKISSYCAQQLKLKKLPDEIIKTEIGPDQEHYKNWNLTLSGLLITFDEGQIAPRNYGIQEVLIPNEILKNNYTHETACTLGVINCDGT